MRIIVLLVGLLAFGAALQVVFWKTPDNTAVQALLSHPYLWLIYFLIGVLGSEHLVNSFRRRFEKQTETHSEITTFIFFAIQQEAARLQITTGQNFLVFLTGIGKKNAEEVAGKFLAGGKPRRVLTCGFAGGLNPLFQLSDVVFETTDKDLRVNLLAAGAKPAKFFCASTIATTTAEKQELRRATGADAVEMESEVIQAVCRERRIPCATVRVISDTASEDLPLDFNKLSKPDLSLDYAKLALAIAKSPGKIPALLRLQRNCRFAAERLAAVLQEVVPSR